MKKVHAYEGFEVWWHARQMTLKMFLIIFAIGLAVWSVLFFLIYSHWFYNPVFWVNLRQWIKSCWWSIFNPTRTIPVYVNDSWVYYQAIVVCRALKQYILSGLWNVLKWYMAGAVVFNIFFMTFSLRIFRSISSKIHSPEVKKGSKIIKPEELVKLLKVKKVDIPVASGLKLPVDIETRHVFIVGATGTGKTSLLLNVLKRLRERDERVILFDLKGDFTSFFYRPETDYILNPLDVRCAGWNIFNDLESSREIFDFARAFIPVSGSDGVERYFRDAAKDVLASVLAVLRTTTEAPTNRDVWDIISGPIIDLVEFLRGRPEGKIGYSHIEKYDSNQAAGIKSTIMQFCRIFNELKVIDGDFSIKKFAAREGGGFLFIVVPPRFRELLAPVVSVALNLYISQVLSLPDDLKRRRFMVVDELGALNKIPMLVDGLTLGRSKGLSMWIGIQDFGKIDVMYGRHMRETLWNNCNTKIIFRVSSPDTARFLSDSIGQAEIEEARKTWSMGVEDNRDGLSISKATHIKPVLLSSEIQNFPDLTAVIKIANLDPAYPCVIERSHFKATVHPVILRKEEEFENVDKEENAQSGSSQTELKPDLEERQRKETNIDREPLLF